MPSGFPKYAVPLAALLVSLAASGQTYDVEVRPALNGLDVKIEPVEMTGILVLKLTNNTAGKVRCDMRYDASPQPIYRTSTFVDAGKTEQSTFRAQRKWFRVVVDVECKSTDK
jgi:hypothetical protein